MWFLTPFTLALMLTSACSTYNSGLIERMSKMKVLSDCLGEETIARWKQQALTASKKCQQDAPFIAALLHQLPVVLQNRNPPHYFVPNIPASPQHTYVLTTANQQPPTYVVPPPSYKTYFYVRQPVSPLLYPQATLALPQSTLHHHVINVDVDPNIKPATPKLAGQKETYTNPHLKYEDTEHFHHRQQKLRQAQIGSVFQPSRQFYPALGLKKRSADPINFSGFYDRSASNSAPTTRDQQMRSVLRSRVSDKVRNMTCIMRQMGMLDDKLEPDYAFLEASLLELPVSNELYEEFKVGVDVCRSEAPCRSGYQPLANELAVSREFSNSLQFFKCYGRERLRSCLKADVEGMVNLLERDQQIPIFGVSGPGASGNVAVDELEDLFLGSSGQLVDMLLL